MKSSAPSKEKEKVPAKEKAPPKEKAPIKSASTKALEKTLSARHRSANNLRRDRKVTVGEMIVHVSGTAFDLTEEEGEDENSKGKGKAKKGKGKPSVWIKITDLLKLRMEAYENRPEFVIEREREKGRKEETGCEGVVGWTRMCDRKWDGGRRVFVPLEGEERLLVEEDTKIVFV